MKSVANRKPVNLNSKKPAKTSGAGKEVKEAPGAEPAASPEQQALFSLVLDPEHVEALEVERSKVVVPEDFDIAMPHAVFITEAARVGSAVMRYWEPRKPHNVGLVSVRFQLSPQTPAEIAYLLTAYGVAQHRYLAASTVLRDEQLARARTILRLTRLVIEFVVDDDVIDEKDAMVERLHKEHETDPPTIAKLASALSAWCLFGIDLKATIATVELYPLAMLDEGMNLANALRLRGEPTAGDDVAGSARHDRDAVLEMLRRRVAKARKAARLVFCNNTEIVREFTSAYVRERQRAARQAASGTEPDSEPSAEPEPQGATD